MNLSPVFKSTRKCIKLKCLGVTKIKKLDLWATKFTTRVILIIILNIIIFNEICELL